MWKIIDDQSSKYVAFIAFNYPGTPSAAQIAKFHSETCTSPIIDIFGNSNTGQNYIRQSKNGNSYGLIIACNLANVVLPEMKYVRDNLIGKQSSSNILEAPIIQDLDDVE